MKKFVFLLVLLCSVPARAEGYEDYISTFFETLKKGDVETSVSELYETNPYMTAIPDQIQNVKVQLKALDGYVGKMLSLEKLSTYKVGNSFVHITYLAIYERQPIRFEFQYFKVGDSWRVYSMSYDDDIDDEVKSLARQQALKAQ